MTTKDITLDQFIEEEKERLEHFRKFWLKNQASASSEDKGMWPDSMPPGEWDEQYRCYED